ncbi:MAG: hypothetical protein KC418_04630 [Anaerolineales bacterium]|nr:hypothetical protein [Anaerolineales bacterium]MCB8952230.1 hypothetical protein [Ardenticatenales bacterium]
MIFAEVGFVAAWGDVVVATAGNDPERGAPGVAEVDLGDGGELDEGYLQDDAAGLGNIVRPVGLD